MLIGRFKAYKGIIGTIEFTDGKHHGCFLYNEENVRYCANSLEDLEIAFHKSVDDYLLSLSLPTKRMIDIKKNYGIILSQIEECTNCHNRYQCDFYMHNFENSNTFPKLCEVSTVAIGTFKPYKGIIGTICVGRDKYDKYYGSYPTVKNNERMSYCANSLEDLEIAFHKSVDDYFENHNESDIKETSKSFNPQLNIYDDLMLAQCQLETMKHIENVRMYVDFFCEVLHKRGVDHDKSKLESPEVEIFAEYTPKLANTTYGSEEYKDFLTKMNVALDHHYQNNKHHPEHYENGINDMSLLDIVEMFCDWKAATKRHNDGDIMKSIEINAERFGYDDQLKQIFINTAKMMNF